MQAEKKLSDVPLGRPCTIQSLNAHPETCQQLRDMGFRDRTIVCIVVRTASHIICELHNTRVGISNRIAGNILVLPIGSQKN